MYIPIILGTKRTGRQSEKVAKWVYSELKKKHKTKIIDVRDYSLKRTDNSKTGKDAKKFLKVIKDAKTFVIVTPEYNHSYPGELKMLFDLFFEEYFGKKVGIVTVSGGPFGGIRAEEQLKLLMNNFQIMQISSLNISKVGEVFDKKGKLIEKAYEKRLYEFIKKLKEDEPKSI